MKKAFKQTVKEVKTFVPVTPVAVETPVHKYYPPFKEATVNPLHERFEALNKVGQDKLDSIYSGQIKVLSRYYNDKSIMSVQCESCGLVFFGKINRLAGNDKAYHHKCGRPYSGKNSGGLKNVSSTHKPKKGKQSVTMDQINELIWKDYNYRQVASTLKINPKIIRDYYMREGLI